jgi:hypothetical protein
MSLHAKRGDCPRVFLKVRPCFYPDSQGDPADVSLSVLQNRPDLGRTDRTVRTIQCSCRAVLPVDRLLAHVFTEWSRKGRSLGATDWKSVVQGDQNANSLLSLKQPPFCVCKHRIPPRTPSRSDSPWESPSLFRSWPLDPLATSESKSCPNAMIDVRSQRDWRVPISS